MDVVDFESEMPEEGDKNEIECDISAYVLFHEGETGYPCLSFDILRDNLGDKRNCDTPLTCYFISGSQGLHAQGNTLALLKMSNLLKVKESDNEDEESDDEDSEPSISSVLVDHSGGVNRLRATCIDNAHLAATWSELGHVNVWNLNTMIEAVENPDAMQNFKKEPALKPLYTFHGHGVEGYAVDWAPAMPGTLATGDCSKFIYVWKPHEGGTWKINNTPFTGHTDSVEDIQWSPNEPNVFASCSVDRSVKIWDCRKDPGKACMLSCENAHSKDVNVIHWNRNDPFIASGGDDGKVLVWDLRKFETRSPVATLQYHNGPVCTVEWHPTDSSVLASGGEDDCILQWDLAVEKDEDSNEEEEENVPEQLLFVHQGQKEVKEIHWHPQVPGLMISTALSGFNIFKTISC